MFLPQSERPSFAPEQDLMFKSFLPLIILRKKTNATH
jgi:hypothetical protein